MYISGLEPKPERRAGATEQDRERASRGTITSVRVDYAKLTLPGHRTENQDRVDVIAGGEALLMIAVDGMGGHAHGARNNQPEPHE